jgi:hypothetical protein
MRNAFGLAFLLLLAVPAQAQNGALVRHSLLDGRVTVDLPQALQPMSEEMKRTKYPGARRPTVAFSNATGSVSFGLSWTAQRLDAQTVGLQTAQLRSQLDKTGRVLRWHGTDVLAIDGREVGLLDFDTKAIDADIRNRILLAVVDGRLLLMTINMTKTDEPQWRPLSDRVIRSLRFPR